MPGRGSRPRSAGRAGAPGRGRAPARRDPAGRPAGRCRRLPAARPADGGWSRCCWRPLLRGPDRRLLLGLERGGARLGGRHLDVVRARRLGDRCRRGAGHRGLGFDRAAGAVGRRGGRLRRGALGVGRRGRRSERVDGAPLGAAPVPGGPTMARAAVGRREPRWCSTRTSRTRPSPEAWRERSYSRPRAPSPARVRGACLPLHSSLRGRRAAPAATSLVHLKPGHFSGLHRVLMSVVLPCCVRVGCPHHRRCPILDVEVPRATYSPAHRCRGRR